MPKDTAKIAGHLRRVKNKLGRKAVVTWLLGQIGQEMMVGFGQVVGIFLDMQVEELLQRGRWERVRMGHLQGEGGVRCHRCGARAAGQFWRNGHFRRGMVTERGEVEVKVPMLRCRCCGASGRWEKELWRRFDRLVGDWEGLLISWLEHGSLRSFARHIAQQAGLTIAPSTLSERVKEAEEIYRRWREQPLEEIAPVLVVDGLHFTVGKGPGRRGYKVCAVVAVAVWPEQGRVQIIDFEIGQREDEQTCRRLFERLYRRGWSRPQLVVSDDNRAYRAAAEWVWPGVSWQLCINHKLRAARRRAPAGSRRQFMAEAREIFHAPCRQDAERLAEAFVKRWWAQARGAVLSLMRNLDMALTFYDYPASWQRLIRTNNAAESAMRRLRDGLRRAGGSPGSIPGATVILFASALSFNHQIP